MHEENTTLYMIILSIFSILLYKISSEENFVIGTPVAGRRNIELENIIGMFINTLALKININYKDEYHLFLKDLTNYLLKAFDNQDYQFDDLIERLGIKVEPNRNPLFDVLFVFQNNEMQVENGKRNDLHTGYEAYEYNHKNAKFDLMLECTEINDKLAFKFEYKTSLFKKETIIRFIEYFKEIIFAVSNNINIKIEDILISHKLKKTNKFIEDKGDFKF